MHQLHTFHLNTRGHGEQKIMVNVPSAQTLGIRRRLAITKFMENHTLAWTLSGQTWDICWQLCFYWINVCIDEALIEIWGPLIEQVNIFWYYKGFRFCGFCFSLMENWRIGEFIDHLLKNHIHHASLQVTSVNQDCNTFIFHKCLGWMPEFLKGSNTKKVLNINSEQKVNM